MAGSQSIHGLDAKLCLEPATPAEIWNEDFNMKKLISVFALAAVLAGGAYAQSQEAPRTELTATQIIQKLEALGYTNITEVERDDHEWDVEATSPNGTRVELELDLKDGRILREERDDD
jgi:hypothetical protein